jgi:hypothetical protein
MTAACVRVKVLMASLMAWTAHVENASVSETSVATDRSDTSIPEDLHVWRRLDTELYLAL